MNGRKHWREEKEKQGDAEQVWRKLEEKENVSQHKHNERKGKNKVGNQTVSLSLLSGNYTSIRATTKGKNPSSVSSLRQIETI